MLKTPRLALAGARIYWLDPKEVFARCFEKYVELKLKKQQTVNSYLVADIDHPFWPTSGKMKKLTPIFDEIFRLAAKYMK